MSREAGGYMGVIATVELRAGPDSPPPEGRIFLGFQHWFGTHDQREPLGDGRFSAGLERPIPLATRVEIVQIIEDARGAIVELSVRRHDDAAVAPLDIVPGSARYISADLPSMSPDVRSALEWAHAVPPNILAQVNEVGNLPMVVHGWSMHIDATGQYSVFHALSSDITVGGSPVTGMVYPVGAHRRYLYLADGSRHSAATFSFVPDHRR